jgi:hypothetical protein
MTLINFLDSNLLQTIVILLTGLIALIIYFSNKISEKKDAARIIINEIRLAEKAIIDIKNNKMITELSIILPNNTWQYKKHLFLKNLDQDEINLINDFYYKCTYAEQYRKLIYDIRNNSINSKSSYMQQKLIDIMYKSCEDNEKYNYEVIKKLLIDKANNESWLFTPNTPMENIIQYIENIIFITPTNAGKIIKKIAK